MAIYLFRTIFRITFLACFVLVFSACSLPTYLGTTNPSPVPIDEAVQQELEDPQRRAIYQEIIAQLDIPQGTAHISCEPNFEQRKITLYDSVRFSPVSYSMDSLTLHLIGDVADGKRYFVTLIKPRGGGIKTGDVCFLNITNQNQSIEEKEKYISILASILHSYGVEVLPKYRRENTATEDFIPIAAWLKKRANTRIQLANGDYYTGYTIDGKPHGRGTLVNARQEIFKGEFKKGVLEGMATIYYEDGSVTDAVFSGGKIQSISKQISADGITREGNFANGKLDGEGVEILADGTIYKGAFSQGLRQGNFVVTTMDGLQFNQRWKSGKKTYEAPTLSAIHQLKSSPRCYLASDQWVYFSGDCKNGKAHGNGAAVNLGGDTIVSGSFKEGDITKGQVIYQSGFVYQGALKNIVPDGKGVYANFDGDVLYEGSWSGGVRKGKGICLYQGVMEVCEYDGVARIDEAHRVRLELAAIKEAEQKEKERIQLCENNLSSINDSFEDLNRAVNQDWCDFDELMDAMADAQREEERMNRDHNGSYIYWQDPLMSNVENGRECRSKVLKKVKRVNKSYKKYQSNLRNNQCVEKEELNDIADNYDSSRKQIEKQMTRYGEIFDQYEEWFESTKARIARESAQRRAQGWADTYRYGMETIGRIASDVRETDREIQQNSRRLMKLYGSNPSKPIKIKPMPTKSIAVQNVSTGNVSTAVVNNEDVYNKIAKQCKAEGNSWDSTNKVCKVNFKSRTVKIELPASACYDPSGKVCNSGESIGSPKTLTLSTVGSPGAVSGSAGTGSKHAETKMAKAPSGAESFPIRVSGKGESMPNKMAAVGLLATELSNMAHKSCTQKHDGYLEEHMVTKQEYASGEYGPFTCGQNDQEWWVCEGEMNRRCKTRN